MISYLKFQLKVIYKNKNNWVMLFAVILAVAALYGYNYKKAAVEYAGIEEVLRFTSEEIEISKGRMTKKDEEFSGNAEEEKFEQAYQVLIEKRVERYRSFHEKEYTDYLKHEIDYLKNYQPWNGEVFASDDILGDSKVVFGDYVKGKQLLNRELIEKKLPYELVRYGTSNFMFLITLLKYSTSIIGIALCLILFAWRGFQSFQNRKVKLILTQPFGRLKVLSGNAVVYVFVSELYIGSDRTEYGAVASYHSGNNGEMVDSWFAYENPTYYAGYNVLARSGGEVSFGCGILSLFAGSIIAGGISCYIFKKRNVY